MAYLTAKKKKASLRSFTFLTLLAAGLISCLLQFGAHNPVTKTHELAFITEAEEVEIGEAAFNMMINESGGRYTDNPELSAYVNRIGQNLAKLSDRPDLPYEFVIVNDNTLNAWALPGGKIAINKGLLAILDNEAELAAVLAHEITHAAARHAAQRWERSTIKPGTDLLQTIFNPSHSILVASEMTVDVVEYKYSRDAEYEADKYGLEYMARAGYDITAASTVHEKLHNATEQEPTKTFADTLLDSHPDDANRIHQLKELSIFYPTDGIIAATEYQEKTASIRP